MKTHPTAKLLRRPFLKRRAPLVCSVGILAFAVMGQAAEVTWDGSDAVNNAGWINGLNWVGDLAPNPGDALFFDGTAGLANTQDFGAGTTFNGITFKSGAGAFVLGGDAIMMKKYPTRQSKSCISGRIFSSRSLSVFSP